MSREPAPKKRKRKVENCPNPLFVQWLTEWRDEAASQGKKTQYAFGKALMALKKYPMRLNSGKEAKILDNFGDKICNMLDHKLTRYVEENGEQSLSSTVVPDHHSASTSSSSSMLNIPSPPSLSERNDNQWTVPQPTGDDDTGGDKPRKRRPSNRNPKEYVPLYRSGPYALILTLYRQYKKPTSKGFMLKTELQREAQPLSEKSFTVPDPGSRYTAWSSMSTLITKGYVSKEGSPARYSITETGCLLANKLEAVEAEFGPSPGGTSHPNGGTAHAKASAAPTNQSGRRKEKSRAGPDILQHTATSYTTHTTSHLPSLGGELEYWYIDDHGRQVISKDDAAVTVDDDISIGFLIKADEVALRMSGLRYKRDDTTAAKGSMIFAYLHNDDARDFCPVPASLDRHAASSSSSAVPSCQDPLPKLSARPASSNTAIPSESKPRKKKKQPLLAHNAGNSQHSTLSSSSSGYHHSAAVLESQDSQQSYVSSKSSVSSAAQRLNSDDSQNSVRNSESNRLDSQGSVASVRSTGSSISSRVGSLPSTSSQDSDTRSTTSLKDPPVPVYVLEPGTFDIVLCVDTCETAGGATKSRKQLLLPELQKNGVLLDVRKLQVGDFLWIAREKRVPVPGMLKMPDARELVLDYVVERKRMDDLCGSITDGRFKEQKFRLKQSGLRKPIYLIEDYGSIDHLSIPASTLRQATVNTQVVDGFFLKHTRDNKESAAYLTIMTRYLQGHYSNKTLEAYRRDDLQRLPGSPHLTSRVQNLMTYSEFSQSSVKNKNTTVTETFAKQLLQFSGLTAEKALAITQTYQTPSNLLDAYEACAVEKDKERLLAHIKYGKLQRNVGPVLSKMVCMFYCTRGALL